MWYILLIIFLTSHKQNNSKEKRGEKRNYKKIEKYWKNVLEHSGSCQRLVGDDQNI